MKESRLIVVLEHLAEVLVMIVHVSGSVDPLRDVEVISLELVLADLAQVERRAAKVAKDTKAGTSSPEEVSALAALTEALDGGKPARLVELSPEEEAAVKGLGLLSAKKVIYAANVLDADLAEGNPMVEKVREHAKEKAGERVEWAKEKASELKARVAEGAAREILNNRSAHCLFDLGASGIACHFCVQMKDWDVNCMELAFCLVLFVWSLNLHLDMSAFRQGSVR